MSEDKKKVDEAEETSEVGRREFLTKAVAAAGAIAASGLLASALSGDAKAETVEAKTLKIAPAARRTRVVSNAPLTYAKLANGHQMSIGGKELNDILVREGLLAKDLTGKNTVMTLKLEWS